MPFTSTITITIATGETRVLNRVNQDNYGSEYHYSDAIESLNLKIRHSTDSADKDGMVMKRHNVFLERVVFPTTVGRMEKYTSTMTFRSGQFNDPLSGADLATGFSTWLGSGTVIADLAKGLN